MILDIILVLFPNPMLFISFFYAVLYASTPLHKVERSGDHWHPCIFLDSWGNLPEFYP